MAETRASDNPIVCRLCLSDRKDSLKFIFDETLGPNRVPQKIQQLLSIQVQRNDKLSTMVCNDCIIRLDTFYSYKRQCHRNQARLGEWLAKTLGQSVHDTSFHIKTEVPDLESNEVHFMNGSGILPFKVEVNYSDVMEDDFGSFPISSTAYSVPDPNDHVYLENLPQEDERCPECGKRFQNVQNMRRHFNMTHRKEKRAQMAEIKKPDPKSNSENKNQKESNHSQHEKHSQLPDAQDKDKSQSESQCALKSKSNDKDTSPSEPNQSQCELQSLSTEVKDQNSTLPESNHSQCEIQLQSSEAKDRDTSNSESGISVCTPVSDDNTPADKTTEDLSSDVHMEDVSNTTVDNTTDKTLISDSQNTTSNDGSANNPDENPKEDSDKTGEQANTLSNHISTEPELEKLPENTNNSTKNDIEKQIGDSESKLENTPEKIEFAAGLNLLRKDSPPIELEALSKIENSYIEKCKAMVSMFHTLECACHNAQHKTLRNLLSHLRELRIWFPLFTCYSCMISFNDRSTFTRHAKMKCNKNQLETLIKLSNLKKRTEIKPRLYQNYKCSRCNFLFSFYEDYLKHIEEDHASGDPPFYCTCRFVSEDAEAFKTHCQACYVAYYCDICFITAKGMEDFIQHCTETHDTSEGFALLQNEDFQPRSSYHPHKEADDESNVIEGKRERRKSVKQPIQIQIYDNEVPPDPVEIPLKVIAKKILNLSPQELKNRNDRAKCPVCDKVYSSLGNMLRHYRTHIARKEVTISVPKLMNKEEEETETDNSLYTCPECGGIYPASTWAQHLKEMHPPKHCNVCNKVFNFQNELDQHTRTHVSHQVQNDSMKSDMVTTQGKSKEIAGGTMLMCEVCDSMFRSKEELKVHKVQHHDNSSVAQTNTLFHLNEQYLEDEGMPVLETVDEISEDKESKVLSERFVCELCNRSYASAKTLREHMVNMHGTVPKSDFPKQCEYCLKICSTSSIYYRHIKVHETVTLKDLKKSKPPPVKEEEDYHTCKRCFKVFATKGKLKEHMKSHGVNTTKPGQKQVSKKKRKVLCDLCHISVDSDEALSRHKSEIHSEELDGMPLLTSELELESKISTAIVYTCDICVQSFSTKSELQTHRDTHKTMATKTKNTSVYCKYCKIAFESINELTKHMHVEHNETAKAKPIKQKTKEKYVDSDPKAFKCPICKKGFETMGKMRAHSGWHKRTPNLATNDKSPANTPQATAATKMAKQTKILKKLAESSATKSHISKIPEFQCTSCFEELPNETALQIHVLEKHGDMDALMLIPRCNICNKDFTTQDEYEKHNRLHDLLERQKKQQQGSIQHEFKEHQKIQTPIIQSVHSLKSESPKSSPKHFPTNSRNDPPYNSQHYYKERVKNEFKCKLCNRVFDKQSSLTIHLKVHEKKNSGPNNSSGKKLYSCSICNMHFNFPKELRTHTINAHPF